MTFPSSPSIGQEHPAVDPIWVWDGTVWAVISPGANYLDRANHTGTQPYTTITGLGSAATADTGDFATSSQGGKADSAVQPGSLSAVATSGSYGDLTGKPSLGTAASKNVGYFAQSSHNHAIGDVTGLQGALDDKVATTGAQTAAAVMPTGTTGQRPASPAIGHLRYNTTESSFEGYDGTEWSGIGGGGTVVTSGLLALPTRTSVSFNHGLGAVPEGGRFGGYLVWKGGSSDGYENGDRIYMPVGSNDGDSTLYADATSVTLAIPAASFRIAAADVSNTVTANEYKCDAVLWVEA